MSRYEEVIRRHWVTWMTKVEHLELDQRAQELTAKALLWGYMSGERDTRAGFFAGLVAGFLCAATIALALRW